MRKVIAARRQEWEEEPEIASRNKQYFNRYSNGDEESGSGKNISPFEKAQVVKRKDELQIASSCSAKDTTTTTEQQISALEGQYKTTYAIYMMAQ